MEKPTRSFLPHRHFVLIFLSKSSNLNMQNSACRPVKISLLIFCF